MSLRQASGSCIQLGDMVYTKYGVGILGLLIDNIELWDPTQNEEVSRRHGLEWDPKRNEEVSRRRGPEWDPRQNEEAPSGTVWN